MSAPSMKAKTQNTHALMSPAITRHKLEQHREAHFPRAAGKEQGQYLVYLRSLYTHSGGSKFFRYDLMQQHMVPGTQMHPISQTSGST